MKKIFTGDAEYKRYIELLGFITNNVIVNVCQFFKEELSQDKQKELKFLLLDSIHNEREKLYNSETESIEAFVEEWLNLFPAGVQSGGYYLRSDKSSVLKKMQRFLKSYKYTKKEIFEATKRYLNEKEEQNYAYTQLAHYLIDKNGVSNLASLCEAYINTPTIEENPFRRQV